LPELARVDGAGRIEVVGATPLRAVVRPRAADLVARGLTAADVEQRLRAVGRSLTAGRVREGAAVRPVVVAEPVRTIDELRAVRVGVLIDRSGDVSRALAELALAAILGVLLGTIILRWMIGHWRPTLALAVVIPAALLASFTAFYAAGIPLDVISLSGLA